MNEKLNKYFENIELSRQKIRNQQNVSKNLSYVKTASSYVYFANNGEKNEENRIPEMEIGTYAHSGTRAESKKTTVAKIKKEYKQENFQNWFEIIKPNQDKRYIKHHTVESLKNYYALFGIELESVKEIKVDNENKIIG